MTLAEAQALFHAAMTDGELPPGAVEACFVGTSRLSAQDRIAIHADMWFARQVEALRTEFPALSACLGEQRFARLCRGYLRAHPSDHHDIGRLGRHLPDFLRRHPAGERSDLGDLAELEWTRSEVFFESKAEAIGRKALSTLRPDEFARARLRFVPALRLLSLAHPAHEAWLGAVRGGGGGKAPARTELAVWRAGHEVFHAPLDRNEALALRAALGGAALLDVCARFAAVDEPVTAGFVALASWIDEGWVAAVERPGLG